MSGERSRGLNVLLLIALLGLIVFPMLGSTFYVQLFSKIMILSIFAMSLNLLVGYTGLISLGHAAFYGLAAYSLVFLSSQYDPANLWLTLPAAVLISAAAALIIGLFVLRTSGVYFIMVTLAFAQMLYYLFHDGEFSGGSDGIYIYFKPEAPIFGMKLFDLESNIHFYYFALVAMVLVYLLLRVVLNSLFGRTIVGIRTNEHRMRSLGYPTFRYKLASFVLAGALAGVSGYLSAAQFGFVNPSLLGWHQSGQVLMMVILGGMGTLFGPILGAFVLVLAQEFFSELTQHWMLLMGGFVILAVLVLPNGVGGALMTLFERRRGKEREDVAGEAVVSHE